MDYLSVKDFERFQHYKDRAPPWIKFYASVLDNYEYGCLQDASKSHLMGIWLLASKMENKVPADAEWIAKRIQATEPVDLQPLVVYGFIECDSILLDTRKQDACLETETETETETDISRKKQRESKGSKHTTTWLTPYIDAWVHKMGNGSVAPTGRIAKALKKVHDEYGVEMVGAR